MLKKILKLENLLLFVAFVFPIAISFIISLLNRNLPQLNFYIYFEKCLSVVKQNMGYYGTVFGLFLAMKKYSDDKEQSEKNREEREKDREERKQEREEKLLEKQQEREKELIRIQEESNLLREKEIENRKDNYRPTFIIYNNKIELLMRKDELFLENIKYYPCKSGNYDEEGEFIGVKKSGEYIIEGTEEDPIPDNFYISADTILGEKILFGFLFGEHKIYKYLRDDGCVFLPIADELENYNSEEISQHWTSYNFIQKISEKKELTFDNYKNDLTHKMKFKFNLDKLFFYNSQEIRENLYFFKTKYIQSTLNSSNYKELYDNLFSELTAWYVSEKQFTDTSILEVIKTVYNSIYYNNNKFRVLNNTLVNRRGFIDQEIRIIEKENELKDKREIFILIKKCKEIFEEIYNLKDGSEFSILNLFDCIYNILNEVKMLPNESDGKHRVFGFCLEILKFVFEKVEIVEEKDINSKSEFIRDKSRLLSKIEFKKV